MKNKKIILIALVPVFLIIIYLIFQSSDKVETEITVPVTRGAFDVQIYSSGELESENSQNITIPEKLKDRSLRIYELTITDLVEEGTYVDSGDYVGSLDHQAVEESVKKAQDDLEKALTELQDAKIDSNLNLSNQRDAIINAQLDLEEKKIVMDESIYESPSVIKKAQMDYDKADRKYKQEKNAYKLKREQEENKVTRKFINYRQINDRLKELNVLYNSLRVYAPKAGLITYYKRGFGGVVKVGSRVAIWQPIIATIPDMTNMISRTFINEIDISRVKVGLPVKVGIDAFPEKELAGEVISMANVGQNMPNSDAKVFEVKVKIFDEDNDLRPAMTTSNVIQAMTLQDTLSIPLESVFSNDSLQYVYKVHRGDPVKQIVALGDANENFVLIKDGLTGEDEVYLAAPEGSSDLAYEGIEIYEKQLKEAEEQEQAQAKAREEASKKSNGQKLSPGMAQGMMKAQASAN
ncbi:efflux RND transporter periplasmic adaptor subunit [Sunxiuqinia elliptica]|uniref:Multidrug resistance efflux pump n=1 Tax=Sunxiuqinia elliptica TaxID=655355 RepID=A0A4R6H944_9BACT|nr:efflux RND transporter periplasmic adaptor subunit [Sunxiuqinia elliptica]TDO04973.1 multidrug resistance efflux pump [Sunxiuqinia elliptica]TDO64521.1 multidrug resistance efflux pump [Sunxiuqinia elliptica]